MSWQTLTLGYILIDRSRLHKKEDWFSELGEFLNMIKGTLELKDKDVSVMTKVKEIEIEIESLNWNSHVDEDKLKDVSEFCKRKDYVVKFEFSVYFLHAPDVTIRFSRGG